ncbi:myosin-9 [Copidosoma floridanum]|uniref:myosin-9 n=1 Tax=Copidosoma floridanum TaxID=29053 RepID=UPI0006C9B6F8|nr:myosin-9 [Copidosoma floridanum]
MKPLAPNRLASSIQNFRETFGSLESLFDLRKPIQLEFEDYLPVSPIPLREAKEETSESEYEFAPPGDFIESLKPVFPEVEPHLVLPDHEVARHSEGESELKSGDFRTVGDSSPVLPEAEKKDIAEMADKEKVSKAEDGCNKAAKAPNREIENVKAAPAACRDARDGEAAGNKPPAYPLPPNLGLGVVVPNDKHSDSIMSTIPLTDPCVFEEIMNNQKEAKAIKKIIQEDKDIIQEFSQKEELSVEDTANFREVQTRLMSNVAKLNNITRKLERTIGVLDPSTRTFAKMFDMLPYPHQDKDKCKKVCEKTCEPDKPCERFAFPEIDYPEDKLPRVIVCGNTEENIPKIVVADSRPKSRGKKCIENLTGRLTEFLSLQDKMAKENAQLEGGKYQLQRELLEKDNAVECLQRKICGLQADIRIVMKENSELNNKLNCIQQQQQQSRCSSPQSRPATSASSPSRSPCLSPQRPEHSPNRHKDLSCKCSARGAEQTIQPPLETPPGCESKLSITRVWRKKSNSRLLLVKEDPFPRLREELATLMTELLKAEREKDQLEQQKKLIECANPRTRSGCPEPLRVPSIPSKITKDSSPCLPCSDLPNCVEQQLRDLREQYARLQDDYKSKLCEVSRLRTDSEALRRETREAKEERECLEIKLIDAQERLRAVEGERNDLLGTKEQLVEQEQTLLVARQRFREAQDELEELRTMIRDQATQLDDYQNKYLQAQQIVEEQRRQLDLMDMDNARMNENVTLEIGRVKNQFQEKLAELAPLPDILKQTQMKLQESQQLRMLAEHNCEDLSRELLGAKEKIDAMQTQINDLQRELQTLLKNDGGGRIDELEKKNSELRTDNERMKNAIARFEEQCASMQKRQDEKQHEIAQLTAMLEQVREDSARQVSRTKERCEAIKRSMQAQISDFEIQLAQCRAAAKTAQKERDEIRQKMQSQIGNLNEALQQAQGRIRSLQGHVDYLKVSYSNIFKGQEQCETVSQIESPAPGYDSCDCNY